MEIQELKRHLEQLHQASYNWALCCCRGQSQEAEDVLQTTYLKILEGKARYNGQSGVKTWLFSVIRRTAAENRRRDFWRNAILSRVLRANDARTTASFAEPGLAAALGKLPSRQREVLQLVFYQEMTIEEAAKVMNVSLGTARTHYDRGKKLLRQKLEGAKA